MFEKTPVSQARSCLWRAWHPSFHPRRPNGRAGVFAQRLKDEGGEKRFLVMAITFFL